MNEHTFPMALVALSAALLGIGVALLAKAVSEAVRAFR